MAEAGHQWGGRKPIGHFDRFLERPATLDDFDDETVTAFLHSLLERGNSAPTANKARNHLLALWRMACDKRLIRQRPSVPALREPNRVPRAWSPDELASLFGVFEKLTGTVSGVPASLWWLALHTVLYWTGERIGAILQLRWEHIDLKTGWLVIPAELRKGKTNDKPVQLPAEARELLGRIGYPKRDVIFPWGKYRGTLWQEYAKILKKAGLPHDRKSKFHRMRKTTASYFEAAGGNATQLLDHSQRKVTLAYLDPTIVKPVQPSDLLPPPVKPKRKH